ncbi:hypothetical protein ACDY97_33435 [Rhizobium mongolense]|uniref:hypothetical protein n=1 Tax=Rhizobium mongolense TaxID=57676 RepID=UPI0035565C8E
MSDIGFLDLYAKFAGFKLLVSANRIGCEDEFSKTLHDRLLAGLDGAIHSTRHIMALQREQLSEDDPDGRRLASASLTISAWPPCCSFGVDHRLAPVIAIALSNDSQQHWRVGHGGRPIW